jgi:hypothetical protein
MEKIEDKNYGRDDLFSEKCGTVENLSAPPIIYPFDAAETGDSEIYVEALSGR